MARFAPCRSLMVSTVLFAALVSSDALASPPTTVSYQGLLTGPGGTPVTDGTYPARFSIWTDSTGGTELTSELQSISTKDGLFTTELGKTSGFFDVCPPCGGWLQTQVTIGGGVEVMTPRTHLVAVPNALNANGVYGEVSFGSQRARGIVKGVGGGMNPSFCLVLDSDADGDGVGEYIVTDTAFTGGASRMVVADLNDDGLADRRAGWFIDDVDVIMEMANIGSSGNDGVSIDVGSSNSDLRVVSLNGLPPGEPVLGTLSMHTDPNKSSLALGDTAGDGRSDLTCYRDSAIHVIAYKDGETNEMKVKEKASRTKCSSNLRQTGLAASHEIDESCDESGARSVFTHMSGSTTGTIRMAATGGGPILPECSSAMEMDADGDGHFERWIEELARSSSARSMVAADLDADGLEDNSSVLECDDGSARHVLSGRSGSTTATIRQSATGGGVGLTPECVLAMEMDEDGDGHNSRWLEVDLRSPAGSGLTLAEDSDDDGVADNTSEMQCDATSARSIITGHSGSTTGTIRMQASPDTAGGMCEHSSPGGVVHRVAWNTDADGASLRVANIGSSGQDGVSIELGASSRRLTMGNLGSSGQDGVDLEVGASLRRLTVGNIGSSGQDGVSMNVDGTSRRLTVGNIGSSGQDGVDVDVSSTLRRLTVGNIGSSGQDGVGIEVDATSRRLTVGNIGSSGQDGVSIDVGSSSSKLVVHNIGSSGNDGVSMDAGPYYASLKVGATGIADQETFCVEKDVMFGVRVGIDTLPSVHKLSIGGGGAYCDGTSWVNGSDKNSKENFEVVDGEEILKRLEDLPISRWNYKQDGDAVKHIGPTAQDFKSAFGVGDNDKSISTIDPSGIALAAIQQLIKENEELRARIAKLESQAAMQAR